MFLPSFYIVGAFVLGFLLGLTVAGVLAWRAMRPHDD
jgi:hypothetical protein